MQNPNGMNNLHAMGIHSPNILPYHQNPAELQNNKAFFKT